MAQLIRSASLVVVLGRCLLELAFLSRGRLQLLDMSEAHYGVEGLASSPVWAGDEVFVYGYEFEPGTVG